MQKIIKKHTHTICMCVSLFQCLEIIYYYYYFSPLINLVTSKVQHLNMVMPISQLCIILSVPITQRSKYPRKYKASCKVPTCIYTSTCTCKCTCIYTSTCTVYIYNYMYMYIYNYITVQ